MFCCFPVFSAVPCLVCRPKHHVIVKKSGRDVRRPFCRGTPWGGSHECPSSPVLQGPHPQAGLGLIIHKAGLRLSPLTPQLSTMLLLMPPVCFQQSTRTLSASIFIFCKCSCEGWTWPEPRLSSPRCQCLAGTRGRAVLEAGLKSRALTSLPCCFSLLLPCANAAVPSITGAGSARLRSCPATQPGRS